MTLKKILSYRKDTRMKTHHQFLLLLLCLPFLKSCITIGGSKEPQPAKNLEFKVPGSPFSDLKSKTGDKTWISSKTNNIISYISDCTPTQDPTLDQLEQDALSSLDKPEIKQRDEFNYNQRLGRNTVAQGLVDGVKVKINVISFKKNTCSYNLIYGGVADRFDTESQEFKLFVENFRAP